MISTHYKLKDYRDTLKFEREHPKPIRWDDKYKLYMLTEAEKVQGIWLKEKDQLVAEIIVSWQSDNVVQGDSITVLPEYRRQGLATKLVTEMLNWAENMGFQWFIGEARQGSSWGVFENMGATPILLHKNWQNTGEDYMFFKIEI